MATIRDRLQRPPAELLEAASRRSRRSLRDRAQRVRTVAPTIAQCAVAAAVAWLVARRLIGHPTPFFAPIAAIICLGLTYGQRGRRTFELAAGVALGIGIADVLVLAIGTGAWQMAVVVALAMGVAVLLGGGMMLVNQAAVSAVLVATLQPADGFAGTRFVDALVGGGIGLLVNALVPTDPVRLVRREAEPMLAELACTLEDVASALEAGDRDAARKALGRARAIEPSIERYREALGAGHETATLAPPRRRARSHLAIYATAVGQIDHAVRNTRVLARGAVRAVELGEHVPERSIEALHDLARAVRALATQLAGPGRADAAEELGLRAAALATATLEETSNMSASVIVGQVRSIAADLLRALGMDDEEASAAVRDARARLGY